MEARRFTRYLAEGWTPSGLRRGRASSGLPYLLLLGLAAFGMYLFSFVLVGKPGAAFRGPAALSRSASPASPVPPFPGAQAGGGYRAASSARTPDPWHIAAATAASIVGLWSLGILFTAAVRNRWASMALLYAVLLGILAAPGIAQARYASDDRQGSPSITVNLYYLNPLMSVAEASDTSGNFWHDLNLMFGRTPMWAVTTISHLFLASVCFLLAIPFVSRIAIARALPYEDLGARV